MNKLKKCPCGEVPEKLNITEGYTLTYAFVAGSCCDEWMIEFRTVLYTPYSDETMLKAIEAWNGANRGFND